MTGTTLACPDCDTGGLSRTRSASIARKSTAGDPEHWCENCEAYVDGVERERKTTAGGTRQGVAKRLVDMDPDDL